MSRTAYRTLRAEDALAEMSHHLTQAAHHTKKAHEAQQLYLSMVQGGSGTPLPGLPATPRRRKAPKCLNIWTEHIREHGPGTRQEIEEATGTRFTERAYPYTVQWEDDMSSAADDEFMPDTIFRIRTIKEEGGRGGAPVLFFLWSQRFDLYDEFGVGPRGRPTSVENLDDSDTILGVIHPPETNLGQSEQDSVDDDGDDDLDWDDVTDDTAPEPDRFATMEEWHARWDPFLQELAPHGAIPTDEEQAEMLATMPEDTDQPKAVMAVAMRDAVRATRSS